MVTISIANSKHCISGNMKCQSCQKEIKNEDYLIEEHYISKRGNENDFDLLFHRKCSENKNKKCFKAWNDFDANKLKKRQELELYDSRVKEVHLLMEKYNLTKDDLFDW